MPDLQQQLHVLSQQHNILSGLGEAVEERQRLQDEVEQIDERVTSLVAAAREYGITWQQIGRVLGMSKQAAWERFGKSDPHPIRSLPPSEVESSGRRIGPLAGPSSGTAGRSTSRT